MPVQALSDQWNRTCPSREVTAGLAELAAASCWELQGQALYLAYWRRSQPLYQAALLRAATPWPSL
jgi:hypothetical protein